jgi:two-component system, NarL family, sensor kinase
VTARTAARLAWSLWGLAMVLEVVAILLWLANHAVLVSRFGIPDDFEPQVFLVPGYATVGAVIAARQRNRIGWLFLAFGLDAALLVFAYSYFIRGTIVTPGSLPAARVAGWAGGMLWPSSYLFLCLLLLLFPDGRLPSPRW